MKTNKVMVIGIDGGTFAVILPLIKQGKLPNLAKLIKNGAWGDLRSSVPPVTPPAWVSFMTGQGPGKHGIYNFTSHTFNFMKEFDGNLVSSKSIKVQTLWHILGDHGKRMFLVNIPITYPAFKVNGIMISGLLAPDESSEFVYPEELKQEIIGMGYKVDRTPNINEVLNNRKLWLQRILDTDERRHKVTLQLLGKYPWDVFMVVYSVTDRVSHLFWNEQHARDVDEEFASAVEQAYIRVDERVGDLLKFTDEETLVFVMSDHGFGPTEKSVSMNTWLYEEGFLKLKKPVCFSFLRRLQLRKKTVPVERIFRRFGVGNLSRIIPQKINTFNVPVLSASRKSSFYLVDWKNTVAYAYNWGIYINQKGRENLGIIDRSDYLNVRGKIIARLKELKDPVSGEKIIDEIFLNEKIYQGPLSKYGPDVMYSFKDFLYIQSNAFHFGQLFSTKKEGNHRMEGIFIASGETIKKGSNIRGAEIVDIAPTLLYSMGYPIPGEMDGKALTEIFEEAFLKENPPKFKNMNGGYLAEVETDVFDDDEQQKIMEDLRGLGYLD
ncbi:MAG: alkaline phosphatase family protein [Candidatus Brocadiaceae bacterium]|nr:alkaline phosphatase family protein [Candidatus Brocadiaceae bacterium]